MYWRLDVKLILICPFVSPSGTTTRRFVGHTKDVLSVAFSADNRQIVSGSRDKTIKLWNTLGVCKYTIQVHICKVGMVNRETCTSSGFFWVPKKNLKVFNLA